MDKKFIGKTRILDAVPCMNKGYCYDMPVVKLNRRDYMTMTRKTFVYNLSDNAVE